MRYNNIHYFMKSIMVHILKVNYGKADWFFLDYSTHVLWLIVDLQKKKKK